MNSLIASALWKLDLVAGALKWPLPRAPSLSDEIRAALRHCPQPRVVVDCGANRGEWAGTLLRVHAPERLILIEPSRSLAAGLSDRFKDLTEVSVVNAALSNHLGTAPLFGPDPGSSLASLVRRESVHCHIDFQRDCEHVGVIDFPELLRRTGVQSVDLLKLDVEGHEYEILRGMPPELRASLRCIQFEFGGACIDARVFFRDFWKMLDPDFEILRLARTGAIPIRRYREREERFEQVNFLCVNRRLCSPAT